MSARLIRWTAVDPLLAGPYRPAGNTPVRPFELPASATAPFDFGHLEPGPAWPRSLAPIERLAALPRPRESLGVPGERVVLYLRSPGGEKTVLCAREDDRVRWAVDPVLWIDGLLAERYVLGWRRPLPSRVRGLNYALVPHVVKGWLERLQSPRDIAPNPIDFPELPFDDLVDALRRLCGVLAHDAPVEFVAPWPDGKRAAITLTHDVDSPWILDPQRRELLDALLDVEDAAGMRGAWYVTARPVRPGRHAAALDRIAGRGHEIASHGWNHDAKLDYIGPGRQQRRVQRMIERFGERGIAGIRTPWNCRSPGLLEILSRHFEYDTSVPNANAFYSSVSNSGCCSVFPFRHASGIIEVPATLPPDTGLDASRGYDALVPVVDRIVELGGVAVVTVHPQPHQSGNREGIAALGDFLAGVASRHGDSLWAATPREIAEGYVTALCEDG